MSIENMYPSMTAKVSTEKPAEQSTAMYSSMTAKAPAEKPVSATASDMYPSMTPKAPAKPDMAKASEQKPKVEEKPADQRAKADDKPAAKTPEQIEAAAKALTADLQLDAGDVRAAPFAKVAAELGLNKAGAEKLTKLDQETRAAYWAGAAAKWEKASLAEFSTGEIESARDFVQKFGDSDLQSLFNSYGLGSHPAIIRALAKAGAATKR